MGFNTIEINDYVCGSSFQTIAPVVSNKVFFPPDNIPPCNEPIRSQLHDISNCFYKPPHQFLGNSMGNLALFGNMVSSAESSDSNSAYMSL